jgi:NAD(P)-dependent dehydrogenase (short-subunit alcohol dehydrogenase family)
MMSIPEFDITGQKVLIVGGGRGIGKGITLAFAEAGADVAVSALTPTGVNKVAEEVRALGRNALALTGDATKAADMDRVAQQVLEGFGHLDTLVTCVSDSIRKPVVQLPGTSTPGMTEDEWRFIVAPGSFPDPEQMSAEAYQQRDAAAAKTVPLGRVGRLKEVGYVAVFLASPAAAYVTGQTWAVDGGVSIKTA